MIDIHCHILPGVDDGARDFEEARQMIDAAAESGTRVIVATPHSDLRYRFEQARCRDLLNTLQKQHPQGPRLHCGCEVHLTPENISEVMRNPEAYTLNGGDCVLLELPDRIAPNMVNPAVEALAGVGLRVILAHPERNRYMQEHRCYLDSLVAAGCYLQLTARSLSGGFGSAAESTAAYILKRRLAHFIASDAHGATARKPGLAKAYAAVARAYGELAARTVLIHNPEAALTGSPIQRMPAAPSWIASFFTRVPNGLRKQTIAEMS